MKATLFRFALFALLAPVGCGGSSEKAKEYKYHSGTGKIEGKVPAGSEIQFTNTADTGYIARGPIQEDGSFSLTTYINHPTTTVAGVPEGTYKVRIGSLNSTQEIGPPKLPASITVKQGDPPISLKITNQ